MTVAGGSVLVTGSAGYVGTALVRTLASDYEVIGFDKKAPRSPAGADFIECDLTEDESVEKSLNALRQRDGAT